MYKALHVLSFLFLHLHKKYLIYFPEGMLFGPNRLSWNDD